MTEASQHDLQLLLSVVQHIHLMTTPGSEFDLQSCTTWVFPPCMAY